MKTHRIIPITFLFLISFPVFMKAELAQSESVQPKVQVIYVKGEVYNPGSFPIAENETVSVLNAIARAGGLKPSAMASTARIFRRVDSAWSSVIPVNLKDILAGKESDVFMRPEDVLFVPSRYQLQRPMQPRDLLFIPRSYAKNQKE